MNQIQSNTIGFLEKPYSVFCFHQVVYFLLQIKFDSYEPLCWSSIYIMCTGSFWLVVPIFIRIMIFFDFFPSCCELFKQGEGGDIYFLCFLWLQFINAAKGLVYLAELHRAGRVTQCCTKITVLTQFQLFNQTK